MIFVIVLPLLTLSVDVKPHPCLKEDAFEAKFPGTMKFGKKISNSDYVTGEGSTVVFYESAFHNVSLVSKVYKIETEEDYRVPYREAIFLDKFKNLDGIVKFYGCLRNSTNVAIFMEKLGSTLIDIADEFSQKELKHKLKMLLPATKAFYYFNLGNRIHSDIKPDNVALSQDGKYFKIIDFGFGVHIKTLIANFTPHYAAPELISKKVKIALPEQDAWGWSISMLICIFNEITQRLYFLWKGRDYIYSHPRSMQVIKDVLEIEGKKYNLPLKRIMMKWIDLNPEKRRPLNKVYEDMKILLQLINEQQNLTTNQKYVHHRKHREILRAN